MNKKLSILALIIAFSVKTNASGFPTFDAANLLQKVTEYSLLLKEYDEILQQTGLSSDQLLQMVEQYEQTLREYMVLLNQVKALQNKIKHREYGDIVSDVKLLSQEFEGQSIAPQTDAINRRFGESPNYEQLEDLADDALGYMPDDIEQSFVIANDSNIQERQRLLYSSRNEKNRRDIEHLDKQRVSLGDQSELATLQLVVEQNQVLIEQIQTLNEVQLANLTYANQADQRAAQAAFKAKVERLKRIQFENDNPISINERPFK